MARKATRNAKRSVAGKIALEAGAGVLTAAALAAGAAYLLSSKAQRAKAKTWAAKARRDVAASVKRARRMSAKEYHRVVDAAVKRYGSMSDANKAELVHVAADLKKEWGRLQKIARQTSHPSHTHHTKKRTSHRAK